nr:glycosyltransferase family A protein [uncultured Sellimonas sp.]
MKVEVLVAAMSQKDESLIHKMNIQSDAIIGNQCNKNEVWRIKSNKNNITYLSFNERGVGLNRNNALFRSTGDILLFADEDMKFMDNYVALVKEAFKKKPNADGIIFNIVTEGEKVNRRKNSEVRRIHFYNALNYGTVRLAVKRDSILKNRIAFSELFGGGSMFSSGEDSLFIWDMLCRGLKIYTYPVTIGKVQQYESTWFDGYTDKYLYDKGALFSAIGKKIAVALCIQLLLRHKEMYKNRSFMDALMIMSKGIKGYKKLIPFDEYVKK